MIPCATATLDALAQRHGTLADAMADYSTGRRNAARARLRAIGDTLPQRDRLHLALISTGASDATAAIALGITKQSAWERRHTLIRRLRVLVSLPPLPDLDDLINHLTDCPGLDPITAERVAGVVVGPGSRAVASEQGVGKRTINKSVERALRRLTPGCPVCSAVITHRDSQRPAVRHSCEQATH